MRSKLGLAAMLTLMGAGVANAIPPPPPKPAPEGVARYTKEALASTPAPALARQMLDEVAGRMVEFRPDEGRFYGRPQGSFRGICKVETMVPNLTWPGDKAWVDGVLFETRYRIGDTPCDALPAGTTFFAASSDLVVMRVLEAWTQAQAAAATGAAAAKGPCTHQLKKCDVRAVLPTLPVTAITWLFARECGPNHCYGLHVETPDGFWVVTLKTRTPASAGASFFWTSDDLVGVEIGP